MLWNASPIACPGPSTKALNFSVKKVMASDRPLKTADPIGSSNALNWFFRTSTRSPKDMVSFCVSPMTPDESAMASLNSSMDMDPDCTAATNCVAPLVPNMSDAALIAAASSPSSM